MRTYGLLARCRVQCGWVVGPTVAEGVRTAAPHLSALQIEPIVLHPSRIGAFRVNARCCHARR